MLTGDASVNPDAPIICCTAEILANLALREGGGAPVGQVVMDEFHYFADPERGWAWQVPLLELPDAQFVLMSATLGDVTRFDRGRCPDAPAATVAVVRSATRPVPLVHEFRTSPLTEVLEELLSTHQAPVYVVHFTQASAVERAQSLMSLKLLHPSREGRDRRAHRRVPLRPRVRQDARQVRAPRHRRPPRRDAAQVPTAGGAAGPGRAAQGHLRHRHPRRRHQRAHPHRGASPRSRSTTARRPASSAPGSSTRSAAGPGGPASTRWARSSSSPPSTSSRTPRPRRRRGPAATDRQGPQDREEEAAPGQVSWGEPTFDRLVAAAPEPLTSSFTVTHSMLLNVLDRPGDGRAALHHLLTENYETEPKQGEHVARAAEMSWPSRRRGGRGARRARRLGPHRPGHHRPAGDLRPQPAAGAVRPGRARPARPRVRHLRARHGVGHRGRARRPPPGPVAPSCSRPRARRWRR